MTEIEMLEKMCLFLMKTNKTHYKEIPFMSRIIDLVMIDNKATTTYELKLKNWQKGIEQLKEQRIATDYCYLCLPKNETSKKVMSKIIQELSFHGLGLCLWDDDKCKLITKIRAKKSETRSQFANDRLRESLVNYYAG